MSVSPSRKKSNALSPVAPDVNVQLNEVPSGEFASRFELADKFNIAFNA